MVAGTKELKPTLEVEREVPAGLSSMVKHTHGLSLSQRKESGSSFPRVLMLPQAGCRISFYGSFLGETVAHGMTRKKMTF